MINLCQSACVVTKTTPKFSKCLVWKKKQTINIKKCKNNIHHHILLCSTSPSHAERSMKYFFTKVKVGRLFQFDSDWCIDTHPLPNHWQCSQTLPFSHSKTITLSLYNQCPGWVDYMLVQKQWHLQCSQENAITWHSFLILIQICL